MRKGWLILAALLALTGVIPAQAQAGAWTAWLYNSNGTITHVSSEGQVLKEYTLPTVSGQTYPTRVAVSLNGRYVAYVTANPTLKAHRLVIFDLVDGVVAGDAITTDLVGSSLDRFTSALDFSENETQFAYGVAAQDGRWRIELLNVDRGASAAELKADDTKVTALGIAAGVGRVPVIRAIIGGEVAFVMEQIGEPSGKNYGSFLWNPQTGDVRANNGFPGLDNDILPTTGEIIAPAGDLALPANNANFAAFGGQQNALDLVDPSTGRRSPFYNSADRSLAAPRFIQNGERILTAALDSGGSVMWRVIERNGQTVGETPMQIADLFPLANGFIYLTTTNPSTLMVADTRSGINAGAPVGQSAPNARVQLAWAADAGAVPSTSYTPWINLTDVVSVAQATQGALIGGGVSATVEAVATDPGFFVAPTPVFLPTRETFASRLAVGTKAVVTIAGNQTGLHVDPSAESPQLILLFTNMKLDVIDGPNITDGYIWWKIQVPVGGQIRTGWAIEGATGVAYLAPAP